MTNDYRNIFFRPLKSNLPLKLADYAFTLRPFSVSRYLFFQRISIYSLRISIYSLRVSIYKLRISIYSLRIYKGSNDTGSNEKGSNDTGSNDKRSKARQRVKRHRFKKCDKGANFF